VIFSVLVCLLITLGLQWVLPAWWWVMLVPFAWSVLRANSGREGFLVGLLSSGLLWLGVGLYYWFTSGGFIAQRVAAMLQIDNSGFLPAVTALIAAVAGGVGGCTGGLLRALWRPAKS